MPIYSHGKSFSALFIKWLLRLTECGLNGLVLPHHKHGLQLRVGEQGEGYRGVISKYLGWRAAGQKDDCFARLDNVLRYIDSQMSTTTSLWESEFVLGRVFRTGNIALPEHYQKCQNNALCTLNFHRFVAYGLWCADHGYQPAKVHYFTHSSSIV